MATDFETLVPGVPATAAEVDTQLLADIQTSGSKIANTSAYSPFFKLLALLLTAPFLALRDYVVKTVLPGMFLGEASGAMLDLRAADFDITRLAATKALGTLTFSRTGSAGDLPIPSGSIVASPAIDGVVYRMNTTAAGTILDGQSTADVPAQAELVGAAYNLGDGYYSVLETPLAGVTGVTNGAGWLSAPGTDIESDDALRARARGKVASLGQGTKGYYRQLIADFLVADPDDVFFGPYPAVRGFGSRDAYVLLSGGNPTAVQLASLNSHIATDGNHLDGDDMQVFALPGLSVILTATVHVQVNATAVERTAIQAGVEDRVRAVFRESTAFASLPRVRPQEKVGLAPVTADVSATFPEVLTVEWSQDVINPALELPILDSLTVTVT